MASPAIELRRVGWFMTGCSGASPFFASNLPGRSGIRPAESPAELETRTAKSGGRYPAGGRYLLVYRLIEPASMWNTCGQR